MAEEQPQVPIVCPECETTTEAPLPEVGDAVARHNESIHDGAAVAQVDPELADHLADVVAEELGLLE